MENDVYWIIESRATAMLLLLVLSRLVITLGATFDLHLCSALSRAEYVLLNSLQLDGRIAFDNIRSAAEDFGNFTNNLPAAVLYPASVKDIATLIKAIYRSGSSSHLTVAAKGHAHSLHGQAQARNGVVIEMSSLRGIEIYKGTLRNPPYVDVRGGELWIDVLDKTLKEGLAPRSWTDYLYLSVGGTLSNAGISGQAFRHGPQISNVYQLEVVTGKGDVVKCSKDDNSDLFYAALGGLGQFGIITSARIALEPAPQQVKWIRVLYSDFETFTKDQEYLISQPEGQSFDYVEGFVVTNSEGLLNSWRSSLFRPQNAVPDSMLQPAGQIMYYLEVTKHYNAAEANTIDQKVASLLAPLSCISCSVYSTDISYADFLDRVHTGELRLRAKGLWDIPHPWLNLFVPKSKIAEINTFVFKKILGRKSCGPVLIYPLNRNKWDARMSAVTPDEDVFYLVALLRSPSNLPGDLTTEDLIDQNEEMLRLCKSLGTGEKQYLPNYCKQSDWRRHFGERWSSVVERKARYDPCAILAPGQKIFSRTQPLQVQDVQW